MQFTYCFYAAVEDLRHEQYANAMTKLLFCEELCPEDGKTQDYLGVIYDALGDHDEAREHFRRAYEGAPDDLWSRYTTLLMRGDAHDRKEAIRIMEGVTRRNPRNSEALDALKQMYAVAGDYRRSIKAQDRLDALRGYDAYSALHRYRCYVLMNQPKKAIQAIDTYLAEDPTNMQFLLFRLEILEHTRAPWSELQAMYQRILAIDPQNPLVLNNYAYGICLHGGDLKQAERMSEIAIRQEPNNATYLDTYAWVLHLQDQNTLASFYIRKAIDLAKEEDRTVIMEHLQAICPEQQVEQPEEPIWHHLRAYGNARIDWAGQTMEARCVARLTRDSAVTISFLMMGSVEVLRLEATPKRIQIINTTQNQTMTLSWKQAAQYLSPAPTWQELCRIGGQGYHETGERNYTLTYLLQGVEAVIRLTYDRIKVE